MEEDRKARTWAVQTGIFRPHNEDGLVKGEDDD